MPEKSPLNETIVHYLIYAVVCLAGVVGYFIKRLIDRVEDCIKDLYEIVKNLNLVQIAQGKDIEHLQEKHHDHE